MTSDPTPATFAGLLRRARKAAGLTQETLGERAGMSAHGVQNLERGVRRPYPDTLRRLAGALGLEGDALARYMSSGHLAWEGRPSKRNRASTYGLPASPTSFVGRERELGEVRRLLDRFRLVTVTGAGGMGKTRLALEVAAVAADAYDDGACVIELAALADSSLLAQTIAASLGIQEQPGRLLTATIAGALTSRRFLLVLDNCEHLSMPAPNLSSCCCASAHG